MEMLAEKTREDISESLFSEKVYWLNQISGELPETNFITDYIRPKEYSGKNKSVKFALDKTVSQAVLKLSNDSHSSVYVFLLSVVNILLAKYTNNSDLIVGIPILGTDNHAKTSVNTVLPLRSQLSQDLTFKDVLLQVKEDTVSAYVNQNYPVDKVSQLLELSSYQNRCPLFDVVVLLKTIHSYDDAIALNNDVTISFDIENDCIKGTLEYSDALFVDGMMDAIAKCYTTLVDCVINQLDIKLADITFLDSADRFQLLASFNNNHRIYPLEQTISTLFDKQVDQTPDNIAAVWQDTQLTYQELNAKANQVARLLQSLGLKPGEFVGILKDRDINFLIAILAIHKAGGAYVPIDSTYPLDRISYMLSNSQVSFLLTDHLALEVLNNLPDSFAGLKHVICLDSSSEKLANPQLSQVSIYRQDDFLQLPQENLDTSSQATDPAYMLYTSGSTGLPKGAIIRHDGAINHIYGQIDALALHKGFNFLQSAPASSDISVWQFLGPLLTGGKTVIVDTETVCNPEQLFNVIKAEQLTLVELVPIVLRGLIEHSTQLLSDQRLLPDLSLMMVTGEYVPVELVNQWLQLYPDIKVANAYGPTEAADDISQAIIDAPLPTNQRTVPIGNPLANLKLYVLDAQMQLVPVGAPGEICVSGIGVGNGYWQNEEKTQLSFLPNPFTNPERPLPNNNKDLIYRTGDLGRWLPNGNLEFLGRIDNQVKIRGFRIELGEVEAALTKYADVGQVAAIVREDLPGEKRLVAYLTGVEQASPDIAEIRHFLKQRLPDYMVPSAYVILDELPLTPSGKVDRKALPAPTLEQTRTTPWVAPQTERQVLIAELMAKVLSLPTEQVGLHDSFFELGGHSLLATQLLARLRQAFEVDLPLRRLFSSPTVSGLDHALNEIEQGSPLEAMPALVPMARGETSIPLSFAQERLWFLAQLEGPSSTYNMPYALRLTGSIDASALQQALEALMIRHESLRTCFPATQGIATQQVQSTLELPWSVLMAADLETPVSGWLRREAQRPFDLAQGPLWRATLIHVDASEAILALTMHHIISDGWSIGILVRDLGTLYEAYHRGESPTLPPLSVQYADYTLWQHQWLTGEVLTTQLDYWKTQLAGAPTLLELPTDHPRPPQQSFRGRTHTMRLSPELRTQANTLAQQQGVTLFMLLLATFQVLLYRYSSQTDIVVGTPIANRQRTELEPLIGFFANTLVLRTQIDDQATVAELLQTVRHMALEGYAHQDVPFEQVVDALHPQRTLAHSPLFQVMFTLQNAPVKPLVFSDMALQPLGTETVTAKFDLLLSMSESDAGLVGNWEYCTDLFEPATIEQMARHFKTLLQAIVSNANERSIAQLPMLHQAEQQQLLVEWNTTAVKYPHPDQTIYQLFEAQVARTPDAVAVSFDDQLLTYRELNQQANQLAHYLQRQGVTPESRVGLCVERSLSMIVGLIGILKAGGAYVPVDASYPADRVQFMLADADISVLVTQSSLRATLPDHQAQVLCLDDDWDAIASGSTENIEGAASADSLAYVIYTSGSTGQPKGVAMANRALVNLLRWQQDTSVCPQGFTIQFTPISFDVSFQEIFSTLTSGGRLVLISNDQRLDPFALLTLLEHGEIERLFLPFVALESLAEAAISERSNPSSLREVITAGEQLKITPALTEWFAQMPQCQLHNHYGPTESHVVTSFTLPDDVADWPHLPSIGTPIANAQVYILDGQMLPVPIGVAGELYLGGAGLAQGYLNQPQLTASRFIDNPFSAGRLYKTGDRVRYLPDGNIEFLGRIDFQVKIRGFRIELGELEAVLSQVEGVSQAVVVARDDMGSDKRLVAYVIGDNTLDDISLRTHSQTKLPDYMVPSAYVILDELPLTPSGKVDRKALPAPVRTISQRNTYVSPRNLIELKLTQLLSEILHISPIGSNDNFFELGGNSLVAVRFMARIQTEFQVNFPLATLFQYSTVFELAEQLKDNTQPVSQSPLVTIKANGSKSPLFLIHPVGGNVLCYAPLAQQLEKDRPIYGLQSPSLLDPSISLKTIEEMASYYCKLIQAIQPEGPYCLAGYSLGGTVAYEMAYQLSKQGEATALLFLIDSHVPATMSVPSEKNMFMRFMRELVSLVSLPSTLMDTLDVENLTLEKIFELTQEYPLLFPDISVETLECLWQVYKANYLALHRYTPKPCKTPTLLLQTGESKKQASQLINWDTLIETDLDIYPVEGIHRSLLKEPDKIAHIANYLQQALSALK